MQDSDKIECVKQAISKIFFTLRNGKNLSINKLANEYDIEKSYLSKLERGKIDCRISSALRLCEANSVKFSEFAKLLENELGEDFKIIDE